MAAPVLLFVPLDDRPVTFDMIVGLARAAGVDVRTPERSALGDRFRPGEIPRIWAWLEHEASGGAAALIASVEMLCFGGLVASRQSTAPVEEIMPYLRRLDAIAARVPTYVSAVIPRTPHQPTDEDADYWKTADGAAMRRHRDRHLQLNAGLIAAASRGVYRYVLIGQDDTAPGSASQADREALQAKAASVFAKNVLLTSGADELNARLLARWLNEHSGVAPSVHVVYTHPEATNLIPLYEATPLRQTVAEHLGSTGSQITPAPPNGAGDTDILLWVHNFERRQSEARDQHDEADAAMVDTILGTVREAAAREQVVALADVRYANGADRALVGRLLAEPRFAGLVAYAGWNTCSNTLGTAVAQAVVVHHIRAGTFPGDDRIYRQALFARILDDWGYQSVIRPQLDRWLRERGGDPAHLEGHEAAAEALTLERMRDAIVPALSRSFRYQPTALHRAAFPWHRLFEVRLELEVARAGRGRSIVVVDYDPRWPAQYEADKAAILRALGPLVRGIEHVGSTAVPGLAAKPIIDILLGVNAGDLDQIIEPLTNTGYEYNPDWEISMPMRRYFRRSASDGTHGYHLHAVPQGSAFWNRHVGFRDYLRAHPEKAREYGDLKKQIVARHQNSIDYTFAKTEFIRSVEALAGVGRRR